MLIRRESMTGRRAELSATVGKTSLFVKEIFEKYGQGEKYVFDPVSFVYLLPNIPEEESEKEAPKEERAREYVLREKETLKLVTHSERSREFITRVLDRTFMPGPRELLYRKSWKEQLMNIVSVILQDCRSFEETFFHETADNLHETADNLHEVTDNFHEVADNLHETTEYFQTRLFFQRELRTLEQNLKKWKESEPQNESQYQKQTVQCVSRLLTQRSFLERQEEYQLFMHFREIIMQQLQEDWEDADITVQRSHFIRELADKIHEQISASPDEQDQTVIQQVQILSTLLKEADILSLTKRIEEGEWQEFPDISENWNLSQICQLQWKLVEKMYPMEWEQVKEKLDTLQTSYLFEREKWKESDKIFIQQPQEEWEDADITVRRSHFIRERIDATLEQIGASSDDKDPTVAQQVQILSTLLKEADILSLTKRIEEGEWQEFPDISENWNLSQICQLQWKLVEKMYPMEWEQVKEKLDTLQTSHLFERELRRLEQNKDQTVIQQVQVLSALLKEVDILSLTKRIEERELHTQEHNLEKWKESDKIFIQQSQKVWKDADITVRRSHFIRERIDTTLEQISASSDDKDQTVIQQVQILSALLQETDILSLTRRLVEREWQEFPDISENWNLSQICQLQWKLVEKMYPMEWEQVKEKLDTFQIGHLFEREKWKESDKIFIQQPQEEWKDADITIRRSHFIRERIDASLEQIGTASDDKDPTVAQQVQVLSALLKEADILSLTKRIEEGEWQEFPDISENWNLSQIYQLQWKLVEKMYPMEWEQVKEKLDTDQKLEELSLSYPEREEFLHLIDERVQKTDAHFDKEYEVIQLLHDRVQTRVQTLTEQDFSCEMAGNPNADESYNKEIVNALLIQRFGPETLASRIERTEWENFLEKTRDLSSQEQVLEAERLLVHHISFRELEQIRFSLFPPPVQNEMQSILKQMQEQKVTEFVDNSFYRLLEFRLSEEEVKGEKSLLHRILPTVGISALVKRMNRQEWEQLRAGLENWDNSSEESGRIEQFLTDKLSPVELEYLENYRPEVNKHSQISQMRLHSKGKTDYKKLVRNLQSIRILKQLSHFTTLLNRDEEDAEKEDAGKEEIIKESKCDVQEIIDGIHLILRESTTAPSQEDLSRLLNRSAGALERVNRRLLSGDNAANGEVLQLLSSQEYPLWQDASREMRTFAAMGAGGQSVETKSVQISDMGWHLKGTERMTDLSVREENPLFAGDEPLTERMSETLRNQINRALETVGNITRLEDDRDLTQRSYESKVSDGQLQFYQANSQMIQQQQAVQQEQLNQLRKQTIRQSEVIHEIERQQRVLIKQLKEPKESLEEIERRTIQKLQDQLRLERMRRGLA